MEEDLRSILKRIDDKSWVVYDKDAYIDFDLTIIQRFKEPCRLVFNVPIILGRVLAKALRTMFKDFRPFSPIHIKSLTWTGDSQVVSGYWQCNESVVLEITETAYYYHLFFLLDKSQVSPNELRLSFIKHLREAAQGEVIDTVSLNFADYEDEEDSEDVLIASNRQENPIALVRNFGISLDDFLSFYPNETRLALMRIKGMVDSIITCKGEPIHFSALLAGPPGTGKSMFCALIADYAASRGAFVVFSVGSPVQDLLDILQMFPTVLFVVDECEGAVLNREEKTNPDMLVLMKLLDGYIKPPNSSWGLIMTTNRPHVIDPAILRPIRLDEFVEFQPIDNPDIAWKLFVFWCDKLNARLPEGIDQKWFVGKTHAECASIAYKLARMQKFGINFSLKDVEMLIKNISKWTKPQKIKSVTDSDRLGFKT